MRRRRGLFIVLTTVIGLAVLVGAAAVVWRYARPRLPAVGALNATTDAGIVAVVNAAGTDAGVTVTELVATTACENTMFARGHIYTRTAGRTQTPAVKTP